MVRGGLAKCILTEEICKGGRRLRERHEDEGNSAIQWGKGEGRKDPQEFVCPFTPSLKTMQRGMHPVGKGELESNILDRKETRDTARKRTNRVLGRGNGTALYEPVTNFQFSSSIRPKN